MSTQDLTEPRRRRVGVIAALLALVLAAGLPAGIWLLGARSSATFSDTEILDANRLGAATLDIEVGTDDAVFDARNLAPGDRVSGHLEVANVGSLPLTLSVSAVSSAAWTSWSDSSWG